MNESSKKKFMDFLEKAMPILIILISWLIWSIVGWIVAGEIPNERKTLYEELGNNIIQQDILSEDLKAKYTSQGFIIPNANDSSKELMAIIEEKEISLGWNRELNIEISPDKIIIYEESAHGSMLLPVMGRIVYTLEDGVWQKKIDNELDEKVVFSIFFPFILIFYIICINYS